MSWLSGRRPSSWRGALPPTTLTSYRSVLLADPCVYCYGRAETVDHILAKSRKGAEGWENQAPSCRRCNQWKGSVTVLKFLATRAWHPRSTVRLLGR
jgi:5-methylcytosine-specific restriction endonuclease McrA